MNLHTKTMRNFSENAKIKKYIEFSKLKKEENIGGGKEMNGLRYLVALCFIFLTAVIGIQGAAVNEKEKASHPFIKTTNVAEAFYQEGIELSLSRDRSPADFVINGKLPVIYDFPASGEELFIYEFSSIDKEHEAISKITQEGTLKNIPAFAELQKGCLINIFQAKNIILLYAVQYDVQAAGKITDMSSLYQFARSIAPHMESLKNITFSKLNNGITVKYQGSGSMWAGKVVLDYYQYYWQDQEGVNHSECWNNEEFYLKYLGSDSDSLNEIICSYEGPSGGGQGIFQYPDQSFDKDGYLCLGSSGGNSFLNITINYTMTIRSKNGTDIFVLKPL